MQGSRKVKIEALIKQTLSQHVITKIKDPRLGFVTITRVSVSPDLKNAKVYFSVLGEEKVQKSSEAALNHSKGFLQKEIARGINLRVTPRLSFEIDRTLENTMHIESILKKIQDEKSESSEEQS